ncbi:MAG TPA: hypothetical protein VH278_15755 [Burkholderiaceae bacterium]|jgi:hypothetical protein|nr:hypothetical protein [Burkholderiaceae bacterium]
MNAINPNYLSQLPRLRAFLTLVVGGACAEPCFAQAHHLRMMQEPNAQVESALETAAVRSEPAFATRLVGLQATMTQVYPAIGANADGSDLWPCFGRSSPNPDCATVGDPAVQLPRGGMVLGKPAFVWKLQAAGSVNGIGCDALTNGTTGPSASAYKPCAQIATWYEDDTFDSTDDLLQRVVVTQGANRIIYDSGVVDFGPAGPTVSYPVDVILYGDANFGYWPGAAAGPNNGNCSGDFGYPLVSPANPGTPYVVAAQTSCEEPVAGPARVLTYTELATPTYTQVTGAACTSKGMPSPCYTVTWTRTHEIHQDFDVFFE